MKIGKVSESVLKRSVLGQIKTKQKEVLCGAGIGEDCAIFALPQGQVLTGCVQVAAGTTLSAGIIKCANNLATSGSKPFAVMIALVLPETMEEQELRMLMEEAEGTCKALSMQIAGGHTSISNQVKEPIATVTGYARAEVSQVRTTKGAKPGQDIVVSKWIGLEGTALLAKKHKEGLLGRYPSDLVEEAAGFNRYLSVLPEAAAAVKSGVCAMHDASRGGIFAALWELTESSGVGLIVDLKSIPIRQETIEVCEFCNENPYELLSGGCLLMVTEDGISLVKALEEQGIRGSVVGKITAEKGKILTNDGEVRFLDRP